MNYQTLHKQYMEFLRSPANRQALQQLAPRVEPLLRDTVPHFDDGTPDVRCVAFNELLGRYLSRVSAPRDQINTYYFYLSTPNGWSDNNADRPLTPQECTEFALLAEYGFRSGNVQGAIMLHACYHFGVGVPQSFHQALYFARLALAGLGDPEPSGFLQCPESDSFKDYWERLIFTLIAMDSIRARLNPTREDGLYDPEYLVTAPLLSGLSIPLEYIAAYMEHPTNGSAPADGLGILMQETQRGMDNPFPKDLKNDAHRKLELAARYEVSNPVAARQNWELAVHAYADAALLGDAEAAAGVGYCCEHMPNGNAPEMRLLALEWYKHAAKMGSSWAMERVGQFYEKGLCGDSDPAVAQECYRLARQMGMPAAR